MANSVAMFILTAILSSVISIIVGIICADRVKQFFGKLIKTDSDPIIGKWIGTFEVLEGAETKSYIEILNIKKEFGFYVGRIVKDARNYDAIKRVEDKKPVRLKAERKSTSLLTGIWHHPIDNNRSHGSFQLLIPPNGDEMVGVWIGLSETSDTIVSGMWNFAKA